MGNRGKKIFYQIAALLLVIAAAEVRTAGREEGQQEKRQFSLGKLAAGAWEENLLSAWMPAFAFAGREESSLLAEGGTQQESGSLYEKIIQAEGRDEDTKGLPDEALQTPETSDGRVKISQDMEKLLQEENRGTEQGERAGAGEMGGLSQGEISPLETPGGTGSLSDNDVSDAPREGEAVSDHSFGDGDFPVYTKKERKQAYQWDYYQNYDALVKEFYAIDATTMADSELLNLDTLRGTDLTIQAREDDQPQILIYHTHSQETFADSVPGDLSDTIMGAGEYLAEILRRQYGYRVMHHMGQYDVESRDYAYSNSLPEIEKLLEENPSIEVVIDLHRDAVAEGKKLVMDLNGKPTATFMFFNGLSRTKKQGTIDYLPNPYIKENLAFSFQMQVLCNEYYPGLTRKIYLKGYRYNMHLKARTLLVEMGAQTNTVEEIYNACVPLAHVLHMELSGEK